MISWRGREKDIYTVYIYIYIYICMCKLLDGSLEPWDKDDPMEKPHQLLLPTFLITILAII